jgi:hypothetical protein
LEEKVVVARVVAAQTVQQLSAQLVQVQPYLQLAQEPFGVQPHHVTWAFQALGNPGPRLMDFVNQKTLFQFHVFPPRAFLTLIPTCNKP